MTTLCLADLDSRELRALRLLRCVTPQTTTATSLQPATSGSVRPMPPISAPSALMALVISPSTT